MAVPGMVQRYGSSRPPSPVIQLHGVGKRYRVGDLRIGDSLRDAVTRRVRAGWGRLANAVPSGSRGTRHLTARRASPDHVWALRDVTLSVPSGQAVGIIGRNGAGKSTLLKILTRITEPTTGCAGTQGRVSSLLEAGTGFHPELTGRENIFLNGAILGLTRREINERFRGIVDFSEIGSFLDTPVKRYSSGMYLRLAFAVAAHLQPEILLVDEVLAVGDTAFQRRCLAHLASIRRDGRTVVLVSHDLDAVANLCERVIWLEGGRVRDDGPAAEIIKAYLESSLERAQRSVFVNDPNAPVSLERVAVVDRRGEPVSLVPLGEPVAVEVRFQVREPIPGVDCAIYVETMRGARVLDEAWSDVADQGRGEVGCHVLRLAIPSVLAVGDYAIGVWIGTDYDTFASEPAVVSIRVEGSVRGRPNRMVQLTHPGMPNPWEVRREP